MKIEVRNSCTDYNSYRAARVKSMFNAESGANFDISLDLPIEESGWQIGVVVGPSGSGKTSIGRKVADFWSPVWTDDAPIIDEISPVGDFDEVTGFLAAVGLGDVPTWLRPFSVLSAGEQFRANLARLVAESPALVVLDEYSSVVDRQIAQIGSMAFQRAWRRGTGRVVLLTPHYDVLEWLEPDWVFDTFGMTLSKEHLQRPKIEVDVYRTDWSYWPKFEPHHYLKADPMPFGVAYVGFVGSEPVMHLGVSSLYTGAGVEARACRMVVMPEWQGAGIGMRMLNDICARYLRGEGHLKGPATTLFHTSHPGLNAALRRDARWRQVSSSLHGVDRQRSARGLGKAQRRGGFGGHLRAVQGWRYVG